MPKIFTVASGKGGVGKSTTVAGLGRAFATKNLKTLLIDCDAGLSSLDVLLNVSDKVVYNWYDAVSDRSEPMEAVISVGDNLFLSPAPRNPIREEAANAVSAFTDSIKEKYDIILIDAPAGLGAGFERALKAAEGVFIVATADRVSVKDAAAVQAAADSMGKKTVRLIINRYVLKAAKKGCLLSPDELIDQSFVQLLGIVPEDKSLIYQTVKSLKKGKSTAAYMRLADRILGKESPLNLSLLK